MGDGLGTSGGRSMKRLSVWLLFFAWMGLATAFGYVWAAQRSRPVVLVGRQFFAGMETGALANPIRVDNRELFFNPAVPPLERVLTCGVRKDHLHEIQGPHFTLIAARGMLQWRTFKVSTRQSGMDCATGAPIFRMYVAPGPVRWILLKHLGIGLVLMPMLGVVVCAMLGKWRRRHSLRHGLCQTCSYHLTGNTSGTCPECGNAIPVDRRRATEDCARDAGSLEGGDYSGSSSV